MKQPTDRDRFLARQRILVVVILSIHLVFFALNLFGVALMMGYGWERQASLGVSAIPYLVLGVTSVIALVLFILALVYFLKRARKSLTLASVAGLGGYFVSLALALTTDLGTKSIGSQLLIFFLFMVPMIAIYLYRSAERRAALD